VCGRVLSLFPFDLRLCLRPIVFGSPAVWVTMQVNLVSTLLDQAKPVLSHNSSSPLFCGRYNVILKPVGETWPYPHSNTLGFSTEGKAIVIVDDNAVVRKTVGNAFLESGFRLFGEAENGAEGIEVVKQVKPDLAILDLSMPVMNGLQAAIVLRRLFPHMPIILFSLYGDGAVKAEAARAGVDAVVSKTEDIPVLIDKACELLHH
jgi:two-component system, chemotaxis family, chemotaxis protein CheY